MPNPQEQIQIVDFETKLGEQKTRAVEDAEKRIKKEATWFEKKAQKDYGTVYDQMLMIYRAKAEELTSELIKLKESGKEQYLLAVQETVLQSMQRRLDLVLTMFGKDNKDPASQELRSRGIAMLQEAPVPNLIYENLNKHGQTELAEKYKSTVENQAELLIPDFSDTLSRINGGEISEADWALILGEMEIMRAKNKDWVKNAAAITLLGALPVQHRTTLLRKMAVWPDFPSVAESLVASTYVTVAQVVEVATTEAAILKAQIESSKASEKGALEAKMTALNQLIVRVQSKEVSTAQEQMEGAKLEAVKKMRRSGQFGQCNSAKQLLTLKGIFGTLLAVNGAATILANGIMHIKEPSQILENPAMKIGLGMAVAGMEMNNGFGNLVDTPSENLAQVLTRKDKREQDRKMSLTAFEREIGRYPNEAELYSQFADQINAAYTAKRKKQLTSKVSLTMEEMRINWNELPQRFRYGNKQEAEEVMSRWVSRMAGPGEDMNIDAQKAFINDDCRVKYGLPAYENWSEEEKKRLQINQ